MASQTLRQRLNDHGPKRVLALDGGGVRGMLTLSFLSRIEALLRARYGRADLLLSEYFDLIGGTSTGAIIAAGLATGYSVQELQVLYQDLTTEVFRKRFLRRGILFPKYSSKRLRQLLEKHFGGVNLGDDRVRTGLAIVTKRLDTASPWVITNFGKYHDDTPGMIGSEKYPLSLLLLASTAAPTFFPKVKRKLANGRGSYVHTGEMVDGGVTPHNNPALKLLMVASMKGLGLRWPLGRDNLLLISVGTGSSFRQKKLGRLVRSFAITDAARALTQLLDDCDELNQTVLQWFSHSYRPVTIDAQIGDLKEDVAGGCELLSYARYNVVLDSSWLQSALGIKLSQHKADGLADMDNPANIAALKKIGDSAADQMIHDEHLPTIFDPYEAH